MRRIVLGDVGGEETERRVDPLARDLRDAGHEVVYIGRDQSPARLAATAVQEDADLVGLWVAPGAAELATFSRDLRAALDSRDAADVAVFVAGAIGEDEASGAEQAGVARGFPESTPVVEITAWVGAGSPGRERF